VEELHDANARLRVLRMTSIRVKPRANCRRFRDGRWGAVHAPATLRQKRARAVPCKGDARTHPPPDLNRSEGWAWVHASLPDGSCVIRLAEGNATGAWPLVCAATGSATPSRSPRIAARRREVSAIVTNLSRLRTILELLLMSNVALGEWKFHQEKPP